MVTVNPIIPGFAPDPSVVQVGDWYYLINSSFHLFPGLPIYASKDLLSWQHIGNAIHRACQLSLARSNTKLYPATTSSRPSLATGGLYAPTIRHHEGIFYVVCTNAIRAHEMSGDPKGAKMNFLLYTHDIWDNNWSDPVYFEFGGIDPSLVFDDEKVYLHGAASAGIAMVQIDVTTGAKISPEIIIWTGSGGLHAEGPHIYKRSGWYYLLVSEGGTHEGHMVTMARSKNIWGPYDSCPANPVLTARNTSEYIQHVGHCEAFEDGEEKWWGVCLGVRKDSSDRYILGRETFITSAIWDGQWLSFDSVKLEPTQLKRQDGGVSLSAAPNVDFIYIRDADLSKYAISDNADKLTLTASKADLSHPSLSPTFLGKRQRQLFGESKVTLHRPEGTADVADFRAGLACYKDEHRYVRIFYEAASSSVVFELLNNAQKIAKTAKHKIPDFEDLILKLTYTEQNYELSYRNEKSLSKLFISLGSIDTLELTDIDFVGPVIGVFLISNDENQIIKFTELKI